MQINNTQIEVLVGSRRANVSYAGRAPGFVGLDQINLVVPEGVLGCSVSVVVRVGSQVSNSSTIAVSSDGGVCSDPYGVPADLLTRVSQGQNAKFGVLNLARVNLELTLPFIGTQNITTDTGTASFVEYTPQNIVSSSSINSLYTSIGSCIVFTGTIGEFTPEDPVLPRGLDAGPQIGLNGPRGSNTLKKLNPFQGTYAETLSTGGISVPGAPPATPPFLEPGNYTFTGPGGADVGAFTALYTISSNFTWTNKDAVNNVNRSAGQLVTWNAGSSNELVQIYGYSASGSEENAITGYFTCLERANVGQFTVPGAVLLALPPSGSVSGGGFSIPLAALGAGIINQERTFTAPGLDFGIVVAGNITVKSVSYQ